MHRETIFVGSVTNPDPCALDSHKKLKSLVRIRTKVKKSRFRIRIKKAGVVDHSWASASRRMPPASAFQHPASQSGTGTSGSTVHGLFRYFPALIKSRGSGSVLKGKPNPDLHLSVAVLQHFYRS
jgi:hypothetical protein